MGSSKSKKDIIVYIRMDRSLRIKNLAVHKQKNERSYGKPNIAGAKQKFVMQSKSGFPSNLTVKLSYKPS